MRASEVEKLILLKGWYYVRQKGSHRIYKHNIESGIIVIPFHGAKDLPIGTLGSIKRKAKIDKNEKN